MNKSEILKTFENEVFAIVSFGGRYDEDGEFLGMGRKSAKEGVTIDTVVNNIFYDLEGDEVTEFEESLNDINDIIKAFNEVNDNLPDYKASLYIQQEYREQAAESKRQSLEQAAADFSRKHKTGGVNTLFIEKLLEELNKVKEQQSDWNSGEQRAERYARCAASGCRDSFWEDNDYETGKFDYAQDKLYDILNYIKEHLPLLWAKYESTKTVKE